MNAGHETPEATSDDPPTVTDNPALSRFEIRLGEEILGFAEYQDTSRSRTFVHTVVDDHHEGQGLASQLIGFALDEARQSRRSVIPVCPFVRQFITRNPSYLDLVPDAERFDLTEGD